MDHRLERYLDQQDREYEYGLDPVGVGGSPQDERAYLTREITHIERFLAREDFTTSLVPPHEWYDRLLECKTRLRRLLVAEQGTLQSTIDLHCQGLIKCNLRFLELESEIKELEVTQ